MAVTNKDRDRASKAINIATTELIVKIQGLKDINLWTILRQEALIHVICCKHRANKEKVYWKLFK